MAASETTTADPDLLALPAPPRRSRAIAIALLAMTGSFAATLALGLASDVQYAFGASQPTNVGALARLQARDARPNSFVTAEGELDVGRAISYTRTTESDTFALAPVAGSDGWWVEMRMPGDVSELNRSSPHVFVGRLVPLQSAVFRYRGLGRSGAADLVAMSRDAWVLIDGATPTSYRWTVALALLLAAFAVYSFATIVRLVRRV